MQLYEDILADANDYGLMVIFHGCTLPRGWERMYPNFVACEAVLASEICISLRAVVMPNHLMLVYIRLYEIRWEVWISVAAL